MLTYLATAVCLLAGVLIAHPLTRKHLPSALMLAIRGFAFALGYLFVGAVYVPIRIFVYMRPYEVPYLRNRERNLRERINTRRSSVGGGDDALTDLPV